MPRCRMIASSLICVMAACACGSLPSAPPQVIEIPVARLPPPPAEVMVPREANFRARLLRIFLPSPTTPTPSSANSQAAKP